MPGHGILCGDAEITALVDYLEAAWALTADHLAQGHTEDEAVADSSYPRYGEGTPDRLYNNIRGMYAQLANSAR